MVGHAASPEFAGGFGLLEAVCNKVLIAGMDKNYVVTKLREHEQELKAAGIVHLRLHGSLARGTATAASDVDLIAEFDTSKHLSLLDMVGLENRLSDLLGAHVDLSPQHALKQPVAKRAAHEAVLAF